MADSDEIPADGLTLQQAFLRYSEPETLKTYLAAERQVPRRAPPIRSPYMSSLGLNSPRPTVGMDYETYARLKARKDRLLRPLLAAFREMFMRGELVATAFEFPMSPASERIAVRPDLWASLAIDFRRNCLKGPGFMLIQVHIRQSAGAEDGIGEPPFEVVPPTVLPAGRPSLKGEVIAMLQERMAGDLQAASCAAEARYLRAWINEKHGGAVYRNPVSVENLIRPLYRKPEPQKTT
jgi:hypothetical protein